MSNVVDFTGMTKGPIQPHEIVKWADTLDEAVVLGVQDNGELYVAGSMPDVSRVIHLLELAKQFMLKL